MPTVLIVNFFPQRDCNIYMYIHRIKLIFHLHPTLAIIIIIPVCDRDERKLAKLTKSKEWKKRTEVE